MLLAMLLSVVITMIIPVGDSFEAGFAVGLKVGVMVAIISCITLSFGILHQKNQLSNMPYILLVPLSGLIAFFLGALGGLVPIAFLTTIKKRKK